jgi:hypothetical protein
MNQVEYGADTCCIGHGSFIMSTELNTYAEVTGFSKSLGKVSNVPIVTAALSYDCPKSLQTYILIFHQCLYLPDLTTHLICPNQLRTNGIRVNDCPLQFIFSPEERKTAHSIIAEQLSIPLKLRGVISYFEVRCPTEEEVLNPDKFQHITMTAPSEWEPYDPQLTETEEALTIQKTDDTIQQIGTRIVSVTSTDHLGQNLSPGLYEALSRRVLILSTVGIHNAESKRKGSITAEILAKRWFIGLNAAQRTIENSTQRGVRDVSVSSGMKRLKHTAHQLMFRRIRATVYTDTMFAKQKSLRQNTCAQVYVTTFHWTKIYPMKLKSDVHMTLDRLHKEVGVFATIVPDNAPELVSGDFRRKAIHAGSRIKPIEAYTHNQNLAESAIREVRRM